MPVAFLNDRDMYYEIHGNGDPLVCKDLDFYAFQQMVVLASFAPAFYNAYRHKLLGPEGGWADLRDNFTAHDRFTEASLNHDTMDRLHQVKAPTLVIHYGRDLITPPHLSLPVEQGIPGATGVTIDDAYHVVTGKALKEKFCNILLDFLSSH